MCLLTLLNSKKHNNTFRNYNLIINKDVELMEFYEVFKNGINIFTIKVDLDWQRISILVGKEITSLEVIHITNFIKDNFKDYPYEFV